VIMCMLLMFEFCTSLRISTYQSWGLRPWSYDKTGLGLGLIILVFGLGLGLVLTVLVLVLVLIL